MLETPHVVPASKAADNRTSKILAFNDRGKILDVRECDPDHQKSLNPITDNDQAGLEIVRHDLTHTMAQAVTELFGAKHKINFGVGPVIENGFYYDIDTDYKITLQDLPKIEEKMREICNKKLPIVRRVVSKAEALQIFSERDERYKLEILNGQIKDDDQITIYSQGDFTDLCRGPHSLDTGHKYAFKLTRIAGAYWRGDSSNPMLQRIYGVAFRTKPELNEHFRILEEAEKRDHRKVGRELGLFHLQEEAPGQVFWHAKGYTLYRIIENYIRRKLEANGYIEVKTPILGKKILWEKSGHWEKFHDNMFVVECGKDNKSSAEASKDNKSLNPESQIFAIKPMNCPLHVQIFNQGTKSYRDLPLRISEFGSCHRNESSGSLHGIMRVLAFTQDDAHIFCTEDQITSEVKAFCTLLKEVYSDFGFKTVRVKFSDRPPNRAGSDQTWDRAEKALLDAVIAADLEYELNPGEGAFYGPKLEFVLKDVLGRDWQCGTIQVDFVLPERLGANYIDETGAKCHPVMVHRAIIGTFERFIGILIENCGGSFPMWLSPIQAVIVNITNKIDDYARIVFEYLKNLGVRVELDLENEKVNSKIKRHSDQKIPCIIVIGEKERLNSTVSVRLFGRNESTVVALKELYNFAGFGGSGL